MTEDELNRWATAARACFNAGKRPGKPWTIQVTAHCPFTGEKFGCHATGKTEALHSAMQELLATDDLKRLRSHPRVDLFLRL